MYHRYQVLLLSLSLALGLRSPFAFSQSAEVPPELEGLEIVEHLNEQLPPDLEFTNQDGKRVTLADYFDGDRPVVLTLNYYRCPMLCGLTLNAMVDGLKQIDWAAGDEFRMVTVSFEPKETVDLAREKRDNYLNSYDRAKAADDWDFLVGEQPSIDKLLTATGFPIRWNEENQEWIHPACIIILTPDGRISRYLYGVYYNPKTLRLSLVEASEGKIGTTVDQILLWCFQYNSKEGSYTFAAFLLMRTAGAVTLVALGSFIAVQRFRGKLRRTPEASSLTDPLTLETERTT
ncbi:SCO family protein [Planctomycetota bacterium]